MIKEVVKTAAAVLLCLGLCGCTKDPLKSLQPVTMESSYEPAYTIADMSGYTMIEGEPAEYRKISMADAVTFFEEDGTGVLYFGKPECNVCQRAAAELDKVAHAADIPVWYVDTGESFSFETYDALMYYIEETCPKDDQGNATFYAPSVIGVRNGEIAGYHSALVKGFRITDETSVLSQKQKKELQGYYVEAVLGAAGK